MAISYPLTFPSGVVSSVSWIPKSVVGVSQSIFSGQSQAHAHSGSWWECSIEFVGGDAAKYDAISAFLLALNGREGTFNFGPIMRATTRGTAAGSWTVGSGAAINTTTLPITGGTGAFVVGDWIQVGTQLFRIVQINTGSVDVFPKLRTAFASSTAITYANAKGAFRLMEAPVFEENRTRRLSPLTINAMEAF